MVICIYQFTFGQDNEIRSTKEDFQTNFNIAKQHLSQRRIKKAIPYLRYLHDKFPENANLKYLTGLCYAELEIVNPITIELLEEAALKSSLDYDPNSLFESRSPIYVYYYLCLAYAQNRMCEESESAREKFVEVYPFKDPYYIKESQKWLQKCVKMRRDPKEDELPEFPDFKPYVSQDSSEHIQEPMQEGTVVDSAASDHDKLIRSKDMLPTHIVTKSVEYSTSSPLYGVQLGAFKEVVPVSRFQDMKNVDAYMDKDGLIRYVVGHFAIYSQAEALLELIVEKGYPDAFVVNVNNTRKFKDEVVSVDNLNIRASLQGRVKYRVQLGAFKERVPQNMMEMYFQVDGIKEFQDEELTCLTVGEFSTYEEAKSYQKELKTKGINDAFVIAIHNNKKISLQKARDYGN
jgi:tetratricopeptide (TPR) repeat protein